MTVGRYYIADIRDLPDPAQEPAVLEGLPEERRRKCLWYVQPADRKRCLGAGLIIRRILRDAGDPPLTYGSQGKPEAPGCWFNISHGGHYVIGIAADGPVGCDIEAMTAPPLETAAFYFHRSERTYLSSHPDPAAAFWQLWTLKESYMKMTGEGMTLPLDGFEVVLGDTIALYRGAVHQNCTLRQFQLDGHAVAICTQGPRPEDPIHWQWMTKHDL